MKHFVVTVKYFVEARDGSDAVHRASAYQTERAYHNVVSEMDVRVAEIEDCDVYALVPVAEIGVSPQGIGEMTHRTGIREIDGEMYYSAAFL